MSGPLGPLGSDAVVITGIFRSVASFASIATLARRSISGTSLTVWNRAGLVVEQEHDSVGGVQQSLSAAGRQHA